jgi:hypothetical protein
LQNKKYLAVFETCRSIKIYSAHVDNVATRSRDVDGLSEVGGGIRRALHHDGLSGSIGSTTMSL